MTCAARLGWKLLLIDPEASPSDWSLDDLCGPFGMETPEGWQVQRRLLGSR